MKRLAVACLFMTALAAGAGGAAADEVHFSYKFEPGASDTYRAKFTQEVDYGAFAMSIFVDMEYTEKCMSAEEGTFAMEITFDKVDASRSMFDDLEEYPMGANLTGKTVTFTLHPNGKVEKVQASGYIEAWDQMGQMIQSIVEASYPRLPDAAKAEGSEWEMAEEMDTTPQGIEVVSNATYVFKEMKETGGRDCARVEAKVQSKMGGTATMPNGVFVADGKGNGKFEFSFDPAVHLLVKVKGKMDVRTDLAPEDGGDTVEMSVGYTFERELK